MNAPLSGLTIVEMPGGIAARYCGRLFATQGATVLQAGRPDAAGVGYGGTASDAYAAWLDAGKRRIDGGLAEALAAAGSADLVISGPYPADVARADAVIARTPGTSGAEARQADGPARAPLRVGLTWFAADGPYRDWRGSDATIQAMCGVAYATGRSDGPPMLPRGHAPQVVGGTTAFIASMAALLGRDAGWAGRHVDLDIFTANLCFAESSVCTGAIAGEKVVRRGVNRFTPTYPGGIYRAADGWIGVTALTPPQWTTLCDMLGVAELARDPRNAAALLRLQRADELEPLLAPAFRLRTAAEWLAEGQARRVPFAPVPSLAHLPATPHWQGRGSFAPVPGVAGAVGPTMPFHFVARPDAGTAPAAATGGAVPDLPLRGVRVLDLSMGWAGPLATRHFADLGAEVVKVESCVHYDWWRGFDGLIDGDPPPYETRPSFLMMNRNKRGITLDLKAEAGRALLRRIAAQSDVMIENYAPGVLDKLGVGPAALSASRPALVCVSMGAFGASGPWSGFRAYGSTVEQASGLPFVNGDADDPPTMQHVAYGDPVGGLYGASAALVGLYARRRQGTGAVIDLGQVECLFQLGADAIVAQSTLEDPLPRHAYRHPGSLVRLVADTREAGRWIAVSAETAAQRDALAALVGAGLRAPADALEQAVRAWTALRGAQDAARALQAVGVAAAPVLAAHDLLDDAQLVHAGFWRWLERAFIGRHVAPLAPFRLDRIPPPITSVAPTLGQHNAVVLGDELGIGPDEISALAGAGVIGTRARREPDG